MRTKFAKSAASLALLVLSGCMLNSPPDIPGRADPYTKAQDRPPEEHIDYHNIPDAVPQVEERSRYGNHSPYYILGNYYEVLEDSSGYSEEGVASWYGSKFHGHRTSTMEVFDMYGMSGAHKTLPLPTYVRVTNLDNGKSIVVRLNDRGPFHDGRIIDLSFAAAARLGFADKGTAQVRVEAIDLEPKAETLAEATEAAVKAASEYIQVGAYSTIDKAQEVKGSAAEHTSREISIQPTDTAPALYRVRIGPVEDGQEMVAIIDRLKKAQLGNPIPVHNN